MQTFRALVADKQDDQFSLQVRELTTDDLPEGEVTIRTAFSSVNYKDGLASIPNGRIVRKYPHIPGIDVAGTVMQSTDAGFREGDSVLVTGYDLGVAHHGGFSEVVRVPATWVVPIPVGLTPREAMLIGTAGFTAALSVLRLEQHGVTPERGPVLVTGATGGVGSVAVDILAQNGYHVVASTGKETEHDFLKQLGAQEVIDRNELLQDGGPLGKEQWMGAVDPVGGKSLANILRSIRYGGSVAVSGLTGGGDVPTTVYPFILRGVNLLGIDSVFCPMEERLQLWERLATDYKPRHLTSDIAVQATLDTLPKVLDAILNGQVRGRTVVSIGKE